ncbi:MAG: hypothetical protein HGB00_02815 [Chlorobiaceae bacterium]|nr:hypothetical protein [Chlorobiaceae bacterium]
MEKQNFAGNCSLKEGVQAEIRDRAVETEGDQTRMFLVEPDRLIDQK